MCGIPETQKYGGVCFTRVTGPARYTVISHRGIDREPTIALVVYDDYAAAAAGYPNNNRRQQSAVGTIKLNCSALMLM